MLRDNARTKASRRVDIGLRTLMCFTSERFQTRRRIKVVMRILRTNIRNSVSISDLV